jgi:hypothetical protein
MAKQIRSMQKKTLNTPDEVRTFDKGKVELATVGTVTFGRAPISSRGGNGPSRLSRL